ncbi:MAG: MFS transporter [Deltaproteobacteria bacterium]|nr:MFS transporter [Deltaproteobacteria bacterium]
MEVTVERKMAEPRKVTAKKSGHPTKLAQGHSPEFRKRRAANWLTLGTTYAGMYMARYNLSMANAELSKQYGWDKTQIGAIISGALLLYGFSAMFNGPIADKMGGRKSMLIGALGAMVFNFLFGMGAYLGFLGKGQFLLMYFTVMWSLNSYFQSYSALSLIKVNAGWFHVSERGVFSAIFGSMIQGGRALIFFLGAAIVAALPWQWVFFIPSAIVGVLALLTYAVVRDAPEDCGLPELDVQDASSGDTEAVSVKYVLRKIFTNPVTLTIAAAEFCTGFVRHGFEQWFPRYMTEAQHLSLKSAVFAKGATGVVLAGIAGAFCAGMLSDWAFKGRRPPVAFIGYAIQVLSLAVVWRSPSLDWIILAFIANSFAISMVHSMLSGTASMDFGGKKAAATACGLFDGMQYLAGSFVGIGMGYLLEHFGWGSWGPTMIGFSAIGAVLMAVLWNARPQTSASSH